MELKIDEQQQAQNLFYQTDLSNAEIAKIVGVSARTISRWISKDNWRRIKEAARHAPSALVEKLYFQLNELLDHISSRQPGLRFPSRDEADTIRKLTSAIEKLKQQTGLCETIDLMMRFTTHVAKHDLKLAQAITREADDFMKGQKPELHKPYELLYGDDDTDCLYEDKQQDDEPAVMDNTGQSPAAPQASPQPLPVKDLQPEEPLQTDPSLSSEKSRDTQTATLGKDNAPPQKKGGISQEEMERIVAEEKARIKIRARRLQEYKRYHL